MAANPLGWVDFAKSGFDFLGGIIYSAEEQERDKLLNRQVDLGFDTNVTQRQVSSDNVTISKYQLKGKQQSNLVMIIGIGALVVGAAAVAAIVGGE
jgi:hypothetical protein